MEQNLTETVTFAVSIESGIVLRPGVVISIADPVKSGSRRSGRISAATTTTVTVDSTDWVADNNCKCTNHFGVAANWFG
jgi:predicted phage tail protein